MLILYGLKSKAKKEIWAGKTTCPQCEQEQNFHLYKETTYFTLFFVPLFPILVKKYLICDSCEWIKTLKGKEYKEIKKKQIEMLNNGQFPTEIIRNDFEPKKLGLGWMVAKLILWLLLAAITVLSVVFPILFIIAFINTLKDYKLALKMKKMYESLIVE